MAQTKTKEESFRPNIFCYHDYREFLALWFDYLKASQPGFSLRNLAKDAKLSCAYLPMMLSAKRPLTEKSLQKLLPQLGLTPQEASYLELLQRASESDTEQLRVRAMDRIHKIGSYQKANPKEVETYRYLTHWFYVVIREMAQWQEFRPDPRWLQTRLNIKVSLQEITQALEFLKNNGFLKFNPDGSAYLPDKKISCTGEVFHVALRQFHREMNEVSLEVIDNSDKGKHHILGHTLSIPAERFPMVKRILSNALQQISELEDSPARSSNMIYHINFMAAPLTKDNKGEQS